MIRLRQETAPPIYQLDTALRLIRTGDEEGAYNFLKAEPLYPVQGIEITYKPHMRPLYTDGAFGDPYKPLAIVPERIEQWVRVVYIDAYEKVQTPNEALWSENSWGIEYFHYRDWFHDFPYNKWDLNEADLRYHVFDPVRTFHVVQIEHESKVRMAVVAWEDTITNKWYCAQAVLITTS